MFIILIYKSSTKGLTGVHNLVINIDPIYRKIHDRNNEVLYRQNAFRKYNIQLRHKAQTVLKTYPIYY